MDDRFDENEVRRDVGRRGVDVKVSLDSMRKATERARFTGGANELPSGGAESAKVRESEIRAAESGGPLFEGSARDANHARISGLLRENAEFRRRTQDEAVPNRISAVAEVRSAEVNHGRARDIRNDRAVFQREVRQAAAAAQREGVDQDYEWVNRGVVNRKLSEISQGEYSGTWESQKTHKYPRESIDTSLRSLPEVRGRLDGGETPDELKALHASPDPREQQIARTYDSYYGVDAISVEHSADGRSRVLNGRHRLDSADRMGIEELPMRVRVQVRKASGRGT